MGGKTAIALGLVTGLVAGGAIVAAVVALSPPPPAPVPAMSPPPSLAPPASASPVAPSASAAPPSGEPDPSASAAAPSGEPGPSASSSLSEAFGIGQPAPPLQLQVHLWIDDGALGGIGPAIMAQGPESILDVEVTP